MDISGIKTTDRTIEIKHPATGDALGIRVGLVSIDDPALKKIKRNITDQRNRLQARGKFFKSEQIEENKFELIFGAMTKWEWYNPTGEAPAKNEKKPEGFDPNKSATFHDEVPDFTRKMVKKVFDELPWFMEQLNDEIGETEAFFEKSKQN